MKNLFLAVVFIGVLILHQTKVKLVHNEVGNSMYRQKYWWLSLIAFLIEFLIAFYFFKNNFFE